MVLTEHHLNCVRNLVRSAAARLGGGVHQDKPTQKNKQMWTCLAILMAGCEIHTQEDMKQQDRADRLQAAYYRQVDAILAWPDLPPYVTRALFLTKDVKGKTSRTKTKKDAMSLINKYIVVRREIVNQYNPVIKKVLSKHTPLKSGTQVNVLYEALVVALTNHLAANTDDAAPVELGGSSAKAAGCPWPGSTEAAKGSSNGPNEDEDEDEDEGEVDDEDEDGSSPSSSTSASKKGKGKRKAAAPSSPAANTRSAAAASSSGGASSSPTEFDEQAAVATQLDEDGASSAVSPTLGAAVALAKYPTYLLAVVYVGVLAAEIKPALDYAIPDSSDAGNSSAGGLSRDDIRKAARAAKDEKNQAASSTTATSRVFQIPSDERAKATSRYAASKEEENKQTAY